jgi:hypothetical protein
MPPVTFGSLYKSRRIKMPKMMLDKFGYLSVH